MAVRQTQQLRFIAYSSTPLARVTSLKTEVHTVETTAARVTSLKAEVLAFGVVSGGGSVRPRVVIIAG